MIPPLILVVEIGTIPVLLLTGYPVAAFPRLVIAWVVLVLLPPMTEPAISHLRTTTFLVASHFDVFDPLLAIVRNVVENARVPPEILGIMRVDA
jgi:hypothetical protein